MPAEVRECRICGCSEQDACVDASTGERCHCAALDLCSACVGQDTLFEQLTLAKAACLGEAFTEWDELRGAPLDESLKGLATFFLSRGFDGALLFVESIDQVHQGIIDARDQDALPQQGPGEGT